MIGGTQAGDEEDVQSGAIRCQAHLESVAEIALPGAGAGKQVDGDHAPDRIMEHPGVSTTEG